MANMIHGREQDRSRSLELFRFFCNNDIAWTWRSKMSLKKAVIATLASTFLLSGSVIPAAAQRGGQCEELRLACENKGQLSRFRLAGQRKRWVVFYRGAVRGGADGRAEHGDCDGGEPGAIAAVGRFA